MIKASKNFARTGISYFNEKFSSFKINHLSTNHIKKFCSSTEMESHPWREASSLIITSRLTIHDVVAKGKNLANVMANATWNYVNKPQVTDYRILMVKRSRSSSFMANAYVFPGGVVEVADYSPLWWPVFEKIGVSRKDLMAFCSNFNGKRPPMITNPVTLKSKGALPNEDYLPSDIALRIAALRETFEETGILILTNPALQTTQKDTTHIENVDIHIWQEKVHNDPYAFLELCLESRMCPDIWSLHEWSDWFTPTAEASRRYDTIFYLCCLPRKPEVSLDKGEVTVMKWCSPEEMLYAHYTSSLFLAPPQVYELSRLIRIQSYHELKNFAKKRESYGCERNLPVISIASDGVVGCLPGDDFYSNESEEIERPTDFPSSLDDLRAKSKNLHRIEMRGPLYSIYCNITPSCGHLRPIAYKPSQTTEESSL